MQPQWQYWCTLNGLIHPFRRQEKISVSMTYRSWSRMVMEDAWWRRWWWRRRPQRGLGPARLARLLLLLLRLHLRLRQGGPHHDARLLLLPALLVVLGDGGGRSGARVLVLVVGAVHEVRRGAGRAAPASAATVACR